MIRGNYLEGLFYWRTMPYEKLNNIAAAYHGWRKVVGVQGKQQGSGTQDKRKV